VRNGWQGGDTPSMALTDARIRSLKPADKPYKVADFEGLYLMVNPSGSKLWRFKYRMAGKEKLLSIGAYPEVTLAKARQARDVARSQVAERVDPSAKKREHAFLYGKAQEQTFERIAQTMWKRLPRKAAHPRHWKSMLGSWEW
jgi:Arm DNA-binding domain